MSEIIKWYTEYDNTLEAISYFLNKNFDLRDTVQQGAYCLQHNLGTNIVESTITNCLTSIQNLLIEECIELIHEEAPKYVYDKTKMIQSCKEYELHNIKNALNHECNLLKDIISKISGDYCTDELKMRLYNMGRKYMLSGLYKAAYQLFQEADNYPPAVAEKVKILLLGLKGKQEINRAKMYLDEIINTSSGLCIKGMMYAKGVGELKDKGKAIVYYQKASKMLDIEAMKKLSELYMLKKPKKSERYKIGKDLLERSAFLGNAQSMYELSLYYLENDRENSSREIINWLQRSANRCYTKAMIELIEMKARHRSANHDYKKILAKYLDVLDLGDFSALAAIGEMYERGNFGKPQPQKALEYYMVSLEYGNNDVLLDIGRIYHNQNKYEEALSYYESALKHGNTLARKYIRALKEDEFDDILNQVASNFITNLLESHIDNENDPS